MAESHFNLDKANSPQARELLDNGLALIQRGWDVLMDHRDAMVQARDASNANAADWATVANRWKFMDESNVVSNAEAQAAFAAIDTTKAVCDAAIRQLCAQFK